MTRLFGILRNPAFRYLFIPICFFILYLQVSSDFPFWFIYDMDHITGLDLLLIHNESLPAHINHTGFGMYLILSLAQSFAKCFDLITHIKLDDLNLSLNPLLIVGENLDFIRRFSPAIVVLTFTFIGAGLFRFLKNSLSILEQILIFILLLSLPALYYHSAFVRTETYALFYWGLSFFTLSLTGIKNSNKKNIFLILISGVLVGLAFLTKLQVVFYICLLPLILFYFNPDYRYFFNLNHKNRLVIAALNLFLVVIYFAQSWSVVIPPGFADFSAIYGINIFGLAYLGYSFLNILLCFFIKRIKLIQRMSKEIDILSMIVLGFTLSFLFHFFMYDNLAASHLYLKYNFKVLFLRRNSYSQIQELSSMLGVYLEYSKVFLTWVIVPLIVVGFAFITNLRKKSLFHLNSIILFLFLGLLGLNTIVGTRFVLRDLIWFLPMPVIVFILFKQQIMKGRFLIKTLTLILLIALNINFNQTMKERITLNYNQYGFDQKRHLKGVYGNSRYPYEQYLLDKIGSEKTHLKAAFEQANFRNYFLDWGSRVFLNKKINLSHIGVMKEGFRFHPTRREGRIIHVPMKLKASLIVNFQSAKNKRLNMPMPKHINEHSEYLQKFSQASSDSTSLIVPFRDTLIYVFFAGGKSNKYCELEKTDMIIKIGSAINVIEKNIYKVNEMCVFDKTDEVYGILSANEI